MCYRGIYGRKSWQEVQQGRPKWERRWFSVFHLFFVVVVSFFSKDCFAVNEALCILRLNLTQASENGPQKASASPVANAGRVGAAAHLQAHFTSRPGVLHPCFGALCRLECL